MQNKSHQTHNNHVITNKTNTQIQLNYQFHPSNNQPQIKLNRKPNTKKAHKLKIKQNKITNTNQNQQKHNNKIKTNPQKATKLQIHKIHIYTHHIKIISYKHKINTITSYNIIQHKHTLRRPQQITKPKLKEKQKPKS